MSDFVDVGLVGVAIDAGLAVIGAAVGGDPVGADVDGHRRDCARAVPAPARIGLHRAVMGERDVRGAGGLDEGDVGDLGPRLQRRQREELLRRIQPGDIVGDGVGSPVMGDGAVVLPEAVDEIVGKRGDRCDRLRSARNHRGHGIDRQGVRLAFVDEERFVRLAHALTRRAAAGVRAPRRSRRHRMADSSSSSIRPVCRSFGCEKIVNAHGEARIAVINACLPAELSELLYDALRQKQIPAGTCGPVVLRGPPISGSARQGRSMA